MIKNKKNIYKSRNLEKAIKEASKEETRDFFVKLPLSEFRKIKVYVSKNDMTFKEWLRKKIKELDG